MLDKIAVQSKWEIAGSSGITVAVGLPVIDISAGGAQITLPLENHAVKPSQKITISGKGAGVGVGLDVGNPISISGSADSFPSDGIGKIYSGILAPRNRPFASSDFFGNLTVINAGGTVGIHNASLNLAVWTNQSLQECVRDMSSCSITDIKILFDKGLAGVASGPLGALLYKAKAMGLFWGVSLSTDGLAVGADIYHFPSMSA